MLNAYVVHLLGSNVTFGIERGSNAFGKGSRYRSLYLTYDTFRAAYEGLKDLGYLQEVLRGFHDIRSGVPHGENTKVSGTDKLIDLLTSAAKLSLPRISTNPERPTLVLRDAQSQDLDYKPTKVTRAMQERVNRINARLMRHWVDLDISDEEMARLNDRLMSTPRKAGEKRPSALDVSNRTVRRIFNEGSFEIGGRFYGGWWQSVPSDYRKHITIDGKATVEIDYSGLHPAILYAEAGVDMPDDPYDIGLGLSGRNAVKKAMLVLLNAEGEPGHWTKAEIEKAAGVPWAEVERRLTEKHQPIASSFNSSAWDRLQFADSELAEQVMLRFAEWRVPCLPVHDSFIVHHGYGDDLKTFMLQAFEGRYGVVPNLKREEVIFGASPPAGTGPVDVDLSIDAILDARANRGHDRRVAEALAMGMG